MPQATSSPAAPLVILAQTDGTDTIIVQFDQDVTWDNNLGGQFEANGSGGNWISQIGNDVIAWQDGSAATHAPGEPWLWGATDPTLSPAPDPTQTGTTT